MDDPDRNRPEWGLMAMILSAALMAAIIAYLSGCNMGLPHG